MYEESTVTLTKNSKTSIYIFMGPAIYEFEPDLLAVWYKVIPLKVIHFSTDGIVEGNPVLDLTGMKENLETLEFRDHSIFYYTGREVFDRKTIGSQYQGIKELIVIGLYNGDEFYNFVKNTNAKKLTLIDFEDDINIVKRNLPNVNVVEIYFEDTKRQYLYTNTLIF